MTEPLEDLGESNPWVALLTLLGGAVAVVAGYLGTLFFRAGVIDALARLTLGVGALLLVGWAIWFRLSRGANLTRAVRLVASLYQRHEARAMGWSDDKLLPPSSPAITIPPPPPARFVEGRTHRACLSCLRLMPVSNTSCPFCGAAQS